MPHPLFASQALALAASLVPATQDSRDATQYAGPTPSPVQLAWQRAELGVVFHYDLHVFDDEHYVQSMNRRTAIEDPNLFAPTELDVEQWIVTAKEMGARFAILTASHETGFRLWQSDANPYCLSAVAWGDGKRDLVAEFVAACRAHDIAPGIYMGTRWNAQLGVLDFKVTERSPLTQEAYNALIEAEVREICSRYGPLFELWFDGGAYGPDRGGPDVLSIALRLQPDCLFYHNHDRADARWGGTESGTVPYPCWATMPYDGWSKHNAELARGGFQLLKTGDPDGAVWCAAMSDAPLRHHEWFWDAGDDHKVRPVEALVDMYYRSVGRNSTLILGLTPDDRGLLPDADVAACRGMGEALRAAFAHSVGSASGEGREVTLELDSPAALDHVVLRECIEVGERVREYVVEARVDGEWLPLCDGTCIGHKRIHRVDEIVAGALRLRVSTSTAPPQIAELSAYGRDD